MSDQPKTCMTDGSAIDPGADTRSRLYHTHFGLNPVNEGIYDKGDSMKSGRRVTPILHCKINFDTLGNTCCRKGSKPAQSRPISPCLILEDLNQSEPGNSLVPLPSGVP